MFMESTQAFKLLALDESASTAEIDAAHASKVTHLQSLLTKAPSDALKAKYQKMLVQLDEAVASLRGATTTRQTSGSSSQQRSPLSQSKFEDLPSAKARHSQFEDKAEAELSLAEGQVLAGRYTIEEKIAAGGMGVVYRAHDQNRSEDIAIKVMLPSLVKNPRAREKFMDEARLSSKLSHANIVNVYDVQNEGDLFFITMELLEGQDLRDVMENRKLARSAFTKEEVIELLKQIIAGLNHAHKITVHRDLKPENIYLTEDGDYKVMDFGIARVQSTSQRTQSVAVSGTAYYMAPEQLKGAKDIDAKADQYALAVMVYELLSGEVPAGVVKPLHELNKEVGKGFSNAVMTALANNPAERHASLDVFLQALQKGGTGLSLPGFKLQKLAMPALIIFALLLMGGIYQSGLVNLDQVFMSKEAKAQLEAVNAKLQGEVKNYQRRLDTGRRNLASELKEAERNNSSDSVNLYHWQLVTEAAIFESNALIELDGKLAMAESLLRNKTFDQAETQLTEIRNTYRTLYVEFQAGESLWALFEIHQAAALSYQTIKTNSGYGDSELAVSAIEASRQALEQKRSGQLQATQSQWKAATAAYKKATTLAGKTQTIQKQAAALEQKWLVLQRDYDLKSEQAGQATEQFVVAKAQANDGKLLAAQKIWQQAQGHWQQAVKFAAVNVARINGERKVSAEQQSQAEEYRIIKAEADKVKTLNEAKAFLIKYPTDKHLQLMQEKTFYVLNTYTNGKDKYSYDYDATGNRITWFNHGELSQSRKYNKNGLVIFEEGSGGSTTYSYNDDGVMVTKKHRNESDFETMTNYNLKGKKVSEYNTERTLTKWKYNPEGDWVYRYERDAGDVREDRREYNYDLNGNILRLVRNSASGKTSSEAYEYNTANQLTKQKSVWSNGKVKVRTNTYNVAGQKTSSDYESGGYWTRVTYKYDSSGDKISEEYRSSDGAQSTTLYKYDASANLLSSNMQGVYEGGKSHQNKKTYTYKPIKPIFNTHR
jgi:serine/threonine protein kinase